MRTKQADLRELLKVRPYSVFDFYKNAGLAQRLAKHRIFEYVTLTVIVVNALWISIDQDQNTAKTIDLAEPQFMFMENFFCCFFSIEIGVRFQAFKLKWNCTKDNWFRFDSCLVLLMIFETWILPLIAAAGQRVEFDGGSLIFLRLLRLLRVSWL